MYFYGMLIHTKGILLKTNVYGNTSLICQLLTVEHGLVSLMFKGIRTQKQRNQLAQLQPTAILSVVFQQKPSRQIHPVSTFQSEFSFLHILSSPHKISILFILQELLWKVHKYHPLEPQELEFHITSLHELSNNFSHHFLLFWLIDLIQILNLEPNLIPPDPSCTFSLEEAIWTYQNTGVNCHFMGYWNQISNRRNQPIELSAVERHELIEILIAYLQAQITDFGQIKSLDIIRSIYRKS